MSFDPTFKISERRKEIETGIANSLAHVEKLRKELLELEVAERVLMRLYDLPSLTQTEPPAETTSSPSNASEHRKPHGLPTISAMILELLEDARKAGKGGITPTDLTDLVQLKWW